MIKIIHNYSRKVEKWKRIKKQRDYHSYSLPYRGNTLCGLACFLPSPLWCIIYTTEMIPYLRFGIRSVIFKQILTALIEVTNGHSVAMDGSQILDGRARRLSVTSTHVSPAVSTGAQ